MDPTFTQNLHNLLRQATAADTTLIKAATVSLNKDFYKNPLCIPALFEIVATSPEIHIRQLAALELRKRISKSSGALWEAISQDTRQTIKAKILGVMFSEENAKVREATAHVIAAIAEIEIPLGKWSDVLQSLLQTTTSSVVAQREIGSFILCVILEKIGDSMQEQLPDFFKLFSTLAHDSSLQVRITSVKALGVLAENVDADEKAAVRQYQEILPSMMTILGQVIEAGDLKSSRDIFDVFDTLLVIETPLLSKHIPQLVQFLLQYAANQAIQDEIRIMTLNALNWTIKYKRSKIQSNNLTAPILEAIFPILAEPIPTDSDEESPSRSAICAVDVLALSLPASQVLSPVRALVERYIVSADPIHRRASLTLLSTSVEGTAELLAQHMQDVWRIIDRSMVDADPEVRKAACTAISCLCDHLEEECVARHAQLIPAILALLNEPITQRNACLALDTMLEILPNDVEPYLNPIMERLIVLLDSVSTDVKAVIMGAIGSAAHSAKERFVPYFQTTVAKVQQFLTLGDSTEEVELKGITMDALGTFAQAVGKEVFQPYYADLMKQAFLFVESGNPRLSECSFITFDVLSDVYGEEFAPYLPTVIPAIVKSLQQPEHGFDEIEVHNGDASNLATGESSSSAIPVADDDEAELELDINGDDWAKATSAICIEKQHATAAVGSIFVATKRHFLPYVEQVTIALLEQVRHFSDGVRKATFDSLFSIIQVFYQLSEPTEWVVGLPPQVPLHQNVRDLINHILPQLLEFFSEDDEKTSVSTLFVGLAETINEVGPGFVENHVKDILEMVGIVLQQKALCQLDPDQDVSEELPEDQAEEDSTLISAAADVVAALGTVLGPQFQEPFQMFFPLIAKYYGENRSASDRSSTIGCMGEIIGGMKSAITPFTEPILQLLFTALVDSDAQVQSNAAFASGMLVENSGADLSAQYLHLLAALRPLFEVPADALSARFNARDNAAGAVARMIVKKTEAVPLDQVLPIFMSALPLKNDYIENRPVFRAVFHLVQSNPSVLGPYIDQLLSVFSHVLNPDGADQLGDETRRGVLDLVAMFHSQAPEKIQAAGLTVYLPSA